LTKNENVSIFEPRANFKHDQNLWINDQLFGANKKSLQLAQIICNYKSGLASRLKILKMKAKNEP
jgi:hypothetical protein